MSASEHSSPTRRTTSSTARSAAEGIAAFHNCGAGRSPCVNSLGQLYRLKTVTAAVAVFGGSATDVALTVTTAGFGTEFGALYDPDAEMVPTVEFPPTIPLTFQVTAVFGVFCTVAVN